MKIKKLWTIPLIVGYASLLVGTGLWFTFGRLSSDLWTPYWERDLLSKNRYYWLCHRQLVSKPSSKNWAAASRHPMYCSVRRSVNKETGKLRPTQTSEKVKEWMDMIFIHLLFGLWLLVLTSSQRLNSPDGDYHKFDHIFDGGTARNKNKWLRQKLFL